MADTVPVMTSERRAEKRGASLASDERGAAIMEFGLVVIPLMALILAGLQTSLAFFAQQGIESTGEFAARQLMTGIPQKASMSKAAFKTLVCTKIPSYMDCSRLMVDVQTATTFNAANTGRPTITFDGSGNPNNNWAYQTGNAGDILIVRVMYPWDQIKAPLGFDLTDMDATHRLLLSTSVLKTEPYR